MHACIRMISSLELGMITTSFHRLTKIKMLGK